MSNRYVPQGATTIPDTSIVIDFALYNDKACELRIMSKIGLVKKILRIIMQIGQCQDISELHELLKAHNCCDMSTSKFQRMVPEGMKAYELWHQKHTSERIIYTKTGSVFYPILFLQNHPE
jgi:hypothetical protein